MATAAPRSWAEPAPQGLRRFVPILSWLPAYDRSLLRFDVIAGATVWGLLVPEMIAYAGLAGLPPQAGLYTLLATLAAYAVFGTSRHVVVAGTSASAVLLASTIGDIAVNHGDYLANAAALVLFVGGLFLLAGICRLGFIAQFLSRPVVEGFVFGLAIFVTVKQLPKLFGVESGEGDTIRQLAHLLRHLGDTSGATLLIGVCALGLLFGVLGRVPDAPGAYGDIGRHPDYARIPDLLVLRLESPLFYANASLVRDQIKRLVGASDPAPTAVVLDAGTNADLDITSAEMLEQLVDSLRNAGVDFALADVRQPVVEMMRRSGLLTKIGEDRIYHTVDEAVRTLNRRHVAN